MLISPIQNHFFINTLKNNNNQNGNNKINFTSVQNGTVLKRLLQYDIPDAYSDIILIDDSTIQNFNKNHVFTKSLKKIDRILYPLFKQHKLFPIEEEIAKIIHSTSKSRPHMGLDKLIKSLLPYHNQKLNQLQKPIFDELNLLATQLPSDILENYQNIMFRVEKELSNIPIYTKFNPQRFIEKLTSISRYYAKIGNKQEKYDISKILNMAHNIPTSDIRIFKATKNIERKQQDIIDKIYNYYNNSSLKKNQELEDLLNFATCQIYKFSTLVTFNRETFIKEILELVNKTKDQKLINKFKRTILKLPSAENNLSAFIVKAKDKSSQQIGMDLVLDSLGSADHVVAKHKNGANDMNNYILSSCRMNSKKAHTKLSTFISNNPDIYTYAQRQIDRLIELANKGIFKKIGLSKYQILAQANLIKKNSPKNKPLIVDTSELILP